MTRVITATVLSAFLLVSAAAAQTPAPAAPAPAAPAAAAPAPAPFPADARIGFVNLQAVVQNSQLGRAGQERLKALTDKKSAEIGEKNKEIQTLQQEIQSGQNVLAAAVLAQKNSDLDRRNRELQFLQEQAQVDVDALQNELLEQFGQKVLPIVEQIRVERNLWAVMTTGDNSGLVAVNPSLDLSAEVVRRLDSTK
jgi:outer membrane protein